MKLLLACAFALALGAQETRVSTRTSVDINGNRVPDGPQTAATRSNTGAESTETVQSINGHVVPLEKIEEHILREDSSGRVVERVIHTYDPNGHPAPPVKQTIEERKRPDGSATIQTNTYRGDINGHLQLSEKSVTEQHKSGSTETADTVVQRPTLNGSLETVEKRSTVTVKEASGYRQDATTYRADGNGSFSVALRRTTEHREQGAQATDNTAEYELGATGQLQLHNQTVTKTIKRTDGSQDVVVDLFGRNVPGTVDAGDAPKLKLYEQQLIEKRPGAGNTVVETLSVRRPTVSDPGVLGPPRQISETVCRGKCDR